MASSNAQGVSSIKLLPSPVCQEGGNRGGGLAPALTGGAFTWIPDDEASIAVAARLNEGKPRMRSPDAHERHRHTQTRSDPTVSQTQ